jgi:hypothetical protein
MSDSQSIKPHMPVVCSKGVQFAVVDHLEGRDKIKLMKDATGQHHYIPTTWVTSVDNAVHIDRPGDRAKREWTTAPQSTAPTLRTGDVPDPTHTERVRSQQKPDPERDPERAQGVKR